MLVREFVRECKANVMRVNPTKNKIMRIGGEKEVVRGEE